MLRAAELITAGDACGALTAASVAGHEAPGRAEAVRLRPEWVDAWVNYGVARYRQGAVEDAKAAMGQAMLHAPEHAAAAANLDAFMRITGETEGSGTPLDVALARDPAERLAAASTAPPTS